MADCSCCNNATEAGEPLLLLPCLSYACTTCVREMQEFEPKTCVFCHEAGCLAGAEPAVPAAAQTPPLLCIMHQQPVDWMCIGCDAVFCQLRECSERATAASDDAHEALVARAEHLDVAALLALPRGYLSTSAKSPHVLTELPTLGGPPAWLPNECMLRQITLTNFDLHLAEIQAELREHNAEQHSFIERVFGTCDAAGHGGCLDGPACDACPTAAERDMQTHLTLLMRETGAADLKVLESERADVAHEMEQLNLVIEQTERLIAAKEPHPTAQTLAVARRGIALLKQPKKKQTTLSRVSVVCIPPPYDRAARACAAVNRLFLRRRRDMACLRAPRQVSLLPDVHTFGLMQHTEGVLSFAMCNLFSRNAGPSLYDLDLQTNEGRARLGLRMVVFARLPDNGIVGHRVVDRSVQDALSCVDLATGAVRWSFALAQAHDGVHLFNDPCQSECHDAPPSDDVGFNHMNKAIASPDGVVVTYWANSPFAAKPGYLVALRPDGAVMCCTTAQRSANVLFLVNRQQFGYYCQNGNCFCVHAIASGAMVCCLVHSTTIEFVREQWMCQAQHATEHCQGPADALFSESLGVPAKAPLYLWTESTYLPLYLHDGRVVLVEKSSEALGVTYSVRAVRNV